MTDGRLPETASDADPLLPDRNILRRVVGGLQPARTWRRWFTRDSSEGDDAPARASGRSQAQAERDIESGDPLGREQQWPRAADSGAASPQPAEPEAPGHRTDASSAADGSGLAAGADPAVERQWRSAHDSEITAAPTAAVEAGRAGPAADAGGTSPTADTTSAPIEHSSGSGPTLGERVASLGHLLGLGSRPEAESSGGTDSGGGSGKSPRGLKRFLSSGEGSGATVRLSRSSSGSQPMCLICLEPLTSEDFLSGEAISLDCQCRGELALRHRACAIKWSRVKGDAMCDICKSPVANLPTPSPRASSSPSGSDVEITIEDYATHAGHPMGLDAVPGNADMLFDCIRVTWVFMIICILFFEMNLSTALWSGIIAGIGYTLFVRAMYRQQLVAAQAEAARVASGNATPPPQPPPMLHHVVG